MHITQGLGSRTFGHLYVDRWTVALYNSIDLAHVLHLSKLCVYYDMHHYMHPKVLLHYLTFGILSFSN